jgi:hypothetical protein
MKRGLPSVRTVGWVGCSSVFLMVILLASCTAWGTDPFKAVLLQANVNVPSGSSGSGSIGGTVYSVSSSTNSWTANGSTGFIATVYDTTGSWNVSSNLAIPGPGSYAIDNYTLVVQYQPGGSGSSFGVTSGTLVVTSFTSPGYFVATFSGSGTWSPGTAGSVTNGTLQLYDPL